jgi:hypothetical protein
MVASVMAAIAIPASAATEGRGDTAEPLVWAFLGLCALIIIAQIAPLVLLLRKQSKITAEQTKKVKIQQS